MSLKSTELYILLDIRYLEIRIRSVQGRAATFTAEIESVEMKLQYCNGGTHQI